MDNQTTLTNSTTPQGEWRIDHTRVVLYCILLVWSLIGNILVITVVLRNQDMRTIFNGMIVNMAVSDLFVPLLALPLNIAQSSRAGSYSEWLVDGPLGEVLCKLCFFFIDISPAVSVFSLVIIAVNRFVAIVFPASLKLWTRKIQIVLIILTWFSSMALFSPYFYTFRLVNTNGIVGCFSEWAPAFDAIPARTFFTSIIIVAVFFIPFFTMTVLYVIMLKKLVQNSKTVADSLNKRRLCSRDRRNKKILYLSVTTVLSFLILWGPFFCLLFTINFIWRWKYPSDKFSVVTFALQYLGYLNSAINPCIYFAFLKAYRAGFKKVFSIKSRSTMKKGQKKNTNDQAYKKWKTYI